MPTTSDILLDIYKQLRENNPIKSYRQNVLYIQFPVFQTASKCRLKNFPENFRFLPMYSIHGIRPF
ncbi:hypothetical protein BG910_03250 [Neisseria chenwenguii]|uniref:Uncharacterized protein n=1 Tax=Neisseria chenwenguii TaxID=1853278 RepID=A0A220S085_9NEIS|nr:hypothetical protein BG910_03250 [Neisseria chenwenguii]ROV56683.1 hypothetical protein EGS38_03245 [Neisseria chenwenguii]